MFVPCKYWTGFYGFYLTMTVPLKSTPIVTRWTEARIIACKMLDNQDIFKWTSQVPEWAPQAHEASKSQQS